MNGRDAVEKMLTVSVSRTHSNPLYLSLSLLLSIFISIYCCFSCACPLKPTVYLIANPLTYRTFQSRRHFVPVRSRTNGNGGKIPFFSPRFTSNIVVACGTGGSEYRGLQKPIVYNRGEESQLEVTHAFWIYLSRLRFAYLPAALCSSNLHVNFSRLIYNWKLNSKKI